VNVAIGSAPDEDLQGILLNLIDSLTSLHIRLLTLFAVQKQVRILDAPNWLKAGVCSQAAKELFDRGLLGPPNSVQVPNRDQLIIGENGVYTFHAALTLLGKQFLSFINKSREDA
jgi:hypothetical protein